MSRNCKRDELNRLANEAQYVAKTTHIDLDWFLSLNGTERAETWCGWDEAAKAQAVTLMLIRKTGDWNDEQVDAYIAYYDKKWALGPADLAVVEAICELEQQARNAERTSAAAGEKSDATYFKREANAYRRARYAYVNGIRPVSLGDRAYVLPSRTGADSHLLRFDGDWRCSCKAGDQMHWAKALIIGVEYAADRSAETDPTPLPFEPNATDLIEPHDLTEFGIRLARARAKLLGNS